MSTKKRMLMVTAEFPATSQTFVLQQIAGAMRNWQVHILARTRGSDEGWVLANKLGIDESMITYANFYEANPLAWQPGCWSDAVGKAAQTERWGKMIGLRRRQFFRQLLSNPNIRNAEYIHTQWAQQVIEVGLPLGKLLNLPVTVSANDNFIETIKPHQLSDLQNGITGIITLSDWSKGRWAMKFGEDERLRRVYLGVDVSRYPTDPPTKDERNNDMPTVVNVGRLAPQKRQWDLIEAIGLLKDEGVAIKAIIVGEGDERARLESLIRDKDVADRVTLAGALPNTEVVTTLRGADIFALPSEWESFGLVTAEGMGAFLATVVSRGGASPELVDEGVTGYTYDVGDVKALAGHLKTLAEDADKRIAMGLDARKRLDTLLTQEVHNEQMQAFWEWALARGPYRKQKDAA